MFYKAFLFNYKNPDLLYLHCFFEKKEGCKAASNIFFKNTILNYSVIPHNLNTKAYSKATSFKRSKRPDAPP